MRRHANESTDPLVGCLGVEVGRTAVAARISRFAVKSSCSCEWGAWDQLSDDGPGHYNPDRSEGPWGKAVRTLERWCTGAPRPSTQIEDTTIQAAECTKGGGKLPLAQYVATGGKAPPDIPALKP